MKFLLMLVAAAACSSSSSSSVVEGLRLYQSERDSMLSRSRGSRQSPSPSSSSEEEEEEAPTLLAPSYTALLERVPKSTVVKVMGCREIPEPSAFRSLNHVCEECFQLFRDQEIYHMCRSDCFGSPYFRGCMDYLIYERNRVETLASLVGQVNQFVK